VLRSFMRGWVDAGRGKPRPYKVEELVARGTSRGLSGDEAEALR